MYHTEHTHTQHSMLLVIFIELRWRPRTEYYTMLQILRLKAKEEEM